MGNVILRGQTEWMSGRGKQCICDLASLSKWMGKQGLTKTHYLLSATNDRELLRDMITKVLKGQA